MGRRTLDPETARAMSARAREARAAGWSDTDAYEAYLDDPDGGRAPWRAGIRPTVEDPLATAIEIASWEA